MKIYFNKKNKIMYMHLILSLIYLYVNTKSFRKKEEEKKKAMVDDDGW